MNGAITGRAFVYGANIDTDQIYPGRYLDLTDPDLVSRHALAGVDPDFVREVKAGDMIVAGANFGCGSSREHAVVTLKASGIGAVLAESFARIFYRNAINLGLPLLVCPGIAKGVQRGDLLCVDMAAGKAVNGTTGVTLLVEPLSAYVLAILESGGIKPMIRREQRGGE
ncbi:MAG: 3-isopropylmalate dehydratase small subunit [Smithellaceae bacterium]|nr:3-isopropylmalate dehydratase small subunit [Smithellaceae bacterium]